MPSRITMNHLPVSVKYFEWKCACLSFLSGCLICNLQRNGQGSKKEKKKIGTSSFEVRLLVILQKRNKIG